MLKKLLISFLISTSFIQLANAKDQTAITSIPYKWVYTHKETYDKLRQTTNVVDRAYLASLNEYNLENENNIHNGIILEKFNQDSSGVMFFINRGVTNCLKTCSLTLRFDNHEVEQYKVKFGHSSSIPTLDFLEVLEHEKFISELKNSHHLIVEMNSLENPIEPFQFELDTSNLKWNYDR